MAVVMQSRVQALGNKQTNVVFIKLVSTLFFFKRELSTSCTLSAIWTKETILCFSVDQASSERGLLLKERICSWREQILSLKSRPFVEEDQNNFDRVAAP